ncbi:MAG: hypothetical protein COV44_00410 [Deltaproteobacteria bacterium CG11_big_fil_rev_8_21_14_0_20_45_16]|nr:MAG: hypothetical protein COV44_00410 [Deltaproteobacteria bacterium CG11_big_fil_rev_8_21_14_0_20_45_16]
MKRSPLILTILFALISFAGFSQRPENESSNQNTANSRYQWAANYFAAIGQFDKLVPFKVIAQWPGVQLRLQRSNSQGKCPILSGFNDLAYPGRQTFVNFPFPADPFSFQDQTA